MPFFKSLPPDAGVRHILQMNKPVGRALIELHQALMHDAILTTCLFNFMNRLLDGHGCTGDTRVYKERGSGLAQDGYAPLLKLLE